MADFIINRGDNFPNLKATLETRNETTGKWEAIDLTLATDVTLYMTSTEPAAIEVYGACIIPSSSGAHPNPAKEGYIEYEWGSEDTNVANIYRLQFEIKWSNGKYQTVPNNGYLSVEVQPDLAADL